MLAALTLALLAQAEPTQTWVEEPPSSVSAPEVAPPAPPPVPSDVPRDAALAPPAVPLQAPEPEPEAAPSASQRFARFSGGVGLGTVFGGLGGMGYFATPFGISTLGLFGTSPGFGSSSLFDVIAGVPGAVSLLPLFAAVGPLMLYPRADGKSFSAGLAGGLAGMLIGGAFFLVLTSFSSFYGASPFLPLIVPGAVVLSGIGSAIGYEVGADDPSPAPRTRTFSFLTSMVAGTALGFGIAGPVGVLGALVGSCTFACTGASRLLPTLTALAIAPLGFGLGPLLLYPKKSAAAYLAGVGAAAVGTASLALIWSGLDVLVLSVGDAGFAIAMAAVRVLTAFMPGLAATVFYDLLVGSEEVAPPVARRLGGEVQVFPSVAFDGKRGMVGLTVTLP